LPSGAPRRAAAPRDQEGRQAQGAHRRAAEELLATFQKAKLIDAYDVYQHLMDYWAETMQDDVYLIASDGWREAAKPRLIVDDKDKKSKDKPDFVVGKQKWKAELIPVALLIARYFAPSRPPSRSSSRKPRPSPRSMEELAEEHGGEDGLLATRKNDKDKLTKASARRASRTSRATATPLTSARCWATTWPWSRRSRRSAPSAKAAQEELTAKVAAKYGKLTEDDIKNLVVEDKWLATLEATVQGELDRVSQTLTGRANSPNSPSATRRHPAESMNT
jgi:type I restriction enzyme M protein